MEINKKEIIEKYQTKEGDTGSTVVQIALTTARINHLTEHLKANNNDNATRRGLLTLVGRNKRLLSYLKNKDIEAYRNIKKELNIRY